MSDADQPSQKPTAAREAAYGTWSSPISAAIVAGEDTRIRDIAVDGDDIYLIESRPLEAGRCVVRRWRDGILSDVLAAPYSARTSVHEYGGGAIAAGDGCVWFSNAADSQIYVVDGDGGKPAALTAKPGVRFADIVHDPKHHRLLAVSEDHTADDGAVMNRIVAIALDGGDVTTLAEGADFYAAPRPHPDGREIAWISWMHPNMPWDETQLSRAAVGDDGSLTDVRVIATEPGSSTIMPAWSPDGRLHVVNDASGWWNLYVISRDGTLTAVAPMERECGSALWNFAASTYAFCGDSIVVAAVRDGISALLRIHDGKVTDLDVPWTSISPRVVAVGAKVVIYAASPTQPDAVHLLELDPLTSTVIAGASASTLDPAWISTPEAISYPTPDGSTAHAFFYPPVNPEMRAPDGTLPPLIVTVHGGPTAQATTAYDIEVQYWTTRGFAMCEVNYGGSTGYGRAYRERLRVQLGFVDVDDCVAAAVYCARDGRADPARLCITGGSAGGYVVLAAVAFVPDVFAAATSCYGIADLMMLVADTHKFESRYFDSLIGPLATHESLYHNRSPLHFASRIRTPLLVLQGSDDPIVPRSQADAIVKELAESGARHAYIVFDGEQHGFRRADSIVRALEAELTFYRRILDLPSDEPAVDLAISGS